MSEKRPPTITDFRELGPDGIRRLLLQLDGVEGAVYVPQGHIDLRNADALDLPPGPAGSRTRVIHNNGVVHFVLSDGSLIVLRSRALSLFESGGNEAHQEGLVFYDPAEHALAIYNDNPNVTHQIGQEGLVRVFNASGADIPDGTPVYATGSEGVEGRATIAPARSNAQDTGAVIGLTTHLVPNGTFGYVTAWGLINGLDTSSFSAGDELFLDEQTPGAMRISPPPPGNFRVQVGKVIRSDAINGRILVLISSNLSTPIGIWDSANIGEQFYRNSYTTNASITPASEIQYTRAYLSKGLVFDRMRAFQIAGGSVARTARMGLYDQADPADFAGIPATKLRETGVITTDAADGTYREGSFTGGAITITQGGFYWLAFVSNTASPLTWQSTLSLPGPFIAPNVRREASSGIVLPASAGTLTTPDSAVVYVSILET